VVSKCGSKVIRKSSLYSDCGKLPFACGGQIFERWFSQTLLIYITIMKALICQAILAGYN
jgi:hypothetical protein